MPKSADDVPAEYASKDSLDDITAALAALTAKAEDTKNFINFEFMSRKSWFPIKSSEDPSKAFIGAVRTNLSL